MEYSWKHNKSLYSKYSAMKARCYRKTSAKYKNYGGRGIVVCDLWLNSFDEFAKWAYSHGYDDTMTLERVNVNGNYCPENCKWIPMSEQAYNKQNTLWAEYRGERMPLMKLCEKYNVNYQSVHFRLNHMGMSIEEAIETPFRDNVTEFARKCHAHNIPMKTVRDRIKKLGWDEERALTTPVKTCKRKEKGQQY